MVLFHSVYGLRPAVNEAADRIRSWGHTVHAPDLYEGAVFGSREEGRQHARELGNRLLLDRAGLAVASLADRVVYAGFSMGAAIAEMMVLGRPGATGALLFSGAMAVAEAEAGPWPTGVPAQVHYGADDPLVSEEAVEALRQDVVASGGVFNAYAYPVAGHLFADPGLADYDEASAEAMWLEVERYLAGL